MDGTYTTPQCPWGLEDMRLDRVGGILEVCLKGTGRLGKPI